MSYRAFVDAKLRLNAAVGSEGYVSLQMGRRFVGVELKDSYFRQAKENLRGATAQADIFGEVA